MEPLISAAALGSIYLMFALGLSLLRGTVRILNFAHGAVFTFAAFANYLVLREVSLPLLGLLGVGVATGAFLLLAANVLAFQPIITRAADPDTAERQLLIAGIALASILTGITEMSTLGTPFGFQNSSFDVVTFSGEWGRISNVEMVIIALGGLFASGLAIWIRKSRAGLALRALGVNSEIASIMGASERSLSLLIVSFAGALAGLSGTLLTLDFGAISAHTGGILLLKAFAIVILGGVGSIVGTVVGAFILSGAETAILTFTSGTWVDAVSFGLLFIILLLRPEGLFGQREVRRT